MAGRSLTILSLWLGSTWAATSTKSPESIELDIIFPRNETYNLAATEAPVPVVFALQNTPAATLYQYTVYWEVNQVGGAFIWSDFINTANNASKFNYTSISTATLIDSMHATNLEAGPYSVDWSLEMSICHTIEDGLAANLTKVISGTHYFTLGKDGVDMSLDKCPDFLGHFAVKDGLEPIPTCPVLVNGQVDKEQACNAALGKDQITCLETYFAGNTSEKACRAGFDDVPEKAELVWNTESNAPAPLDDLGAIHRADWVNVAVAATLGLGVILFS